MATRRTGYKRCSDTAHVVGCHPARPRCKFMRRVQPQRQVCNCDAYLFPHRAGGGHCGKPERRWSEIAEAGAAEKRRQAMGLPW